MLHKGHVLNMWDCGFWRVSSTCVHCIECECGKSKIMSYCWDHISWDAVSFFAAQVYGALIFGRRHLMFGKFVFGKRDLHLGSEDLFFGWEQLLFSILSFFGSSDVVSLGNRDFRECRFTISCSRDVVGICIWGARMCWELGLILVSKRFTKKASCLSVWIALRKPQNHDESLYTMKDMKRYEKDPEKFSHLANMRFVKIVIRTKGVSKFEMFSVDHLVHQSGFSTPRWSVLQLHEARSPCAWPQRAMVTTIRRMGDAAWQLCSKLSVGDPGHAKSHESHHPRSQIENSHWLPFSSPFRTARTTCCLRSTSFANECSFEAKFSCSMLWSQGAAAHELVPSFHKHHFMNHFFRSFHFLISDLFQESSLGCIPSQHGRVSISKFQPWTHPSSRLLAQEKVGGGAWGHRQAVFITLCCRRQRLKHLMPVDSALNKPPSTVYL